VIHKRFAQLQYAKLSQSEEQLIEEVAADMHANSAAAWTPRSPSWTRSSPPNQAGHDAGTPDRKDLTGMSEKLSETAIVCAVAHEAARRITRKVIAFFQCRTDTVGEDSELKTIWDEICVQVQVQEYIYWDDYDVTVRDIVRGYIFELPKHEREAIWWQTDARFDWDCAEPEDRDAYPVFDDDIVDYLVGKYVYAEAERWSNARIRAAFDRSIRMD